MTLIHPISSTLFTGGTISHEVMCRGRGENVLWRPTTSWVKRGEGGTGVAGVEVKVLLAVEGTSGGPMAVVVAVAAAAQLIPPHPVTQPPT